MPPSPGPTGPTPPAPGPATPEPSPPLSTAHIAMPDDDLVLNAPVVGIAPTPGW